jgi:hypothetical protein
MQERIYNKRENKILIRFLVFLAITTLLQLNSCTIKPAMTGETSSAEIPDNQGGVFEVPEYLTIPVQVGGYPADLTPICILEAAEPSSTEHYLPIVGMGALLQFSSGITGVFSVGHVILPLTLGDSKWQIATGANNRSPSLSNRPVGVLPGGEGSFAFPQDLNNYEITPATLPNPHFFLEGAPSLGEAISQAINPAHSIKMTTFRDDSTTDTKGCDNGYGSELASVPYLPTTFVFQMSTERFGLSNIEHLIFTFVPDSSDSKNHAIEGASGSPVILNNPDDNNVLFGFHAAGMWTLFRNHHEYEIKKITPPNGSPYTLISPINNPPDDDTQIINGDELLQLLIADLKKRNPDLTFSVDDLETGRQLVGITPLFNGEDQGFLGSNN